MPGGASRPPIICIPGLTRNARDFEGVAERLAGEWRLICVELRGRGESAYAKDPMTYVPLTYLQDMEALIAELGLERFVLFGTSLGGLITMLLAASGKERIAGALLNDIGPVMETRGLEHIRSYVGRSQNWPTWLHAARFLAEAQGDRYPDWKLDQWLVYAKRLCQADRRPGGSCSTMTCGSPSRSSCRGGEAGFDLWPAFRALAGIPSLVVHGEISDLLSAETVARMMAEAAGDGERHRPQCRPRADARRARGAGGDRRAAEAGGCERNETSARVRAHDARPHPPLPFDLLAGRQGGAGGAADERVRRCRRACRS